MLKWMVFKKIFSQFYATYRKNKSANYNKGGNSEIIEQKYEIIMYKTQKKCKYFVSKHFNYWEHLNSFKHVKEINYL